MHRVIDDQRIVPFNLATALPLHAQMVIPAQMGNSVMTYGLMLIMLDLPAGIRPNPHLEIFLSMQIDGFVPGHIFDAQLIEPLTAIAFTA